MGGIQTSLHQLKDIGSKSPKFCVNMEGYYKRPQLLFYFLYKSSCPRGSNKKRRKLL